MGNNNINVTIHPALFESFADVLDKLSIQVYMNSTMGASYRKDFEESFKRLSESIDFEIGRYNSMVNSGEE